MRSPIEKLDWDMKVTAGSRFGASQRVKRAYRRKQWFLIIFSTLVVLISAVTLVFEFSEPYVRLLGFIGLASSIFILVFSAAQIENSDAVYAHRLYESAVHISALRRDFAALGADSQQAALAHFTKLYNDSLLAHGVNHENRDFDRYKLAHWWEFEDLKDSSRPGIASAKLLDKVEELFPQSAIWAAITAGLAGVIASIASLM